MVPHISSPVLSNIVSIANTFTQRVILYASDPHSSLAAAVVVEDDASSGDRTSRQPVAEFQSTHLTTSVPTTTMTADTDTTADDKDILLNTTIGGVIIDTIDENYADNITAVNGTLRVTEGQYSMNRNVNINSIDKHKGSWNAAGNTLYCSDDDDSGDGGTGGGEHYDSDNSSDYDCEGGDNVLQTLTTDADLDTLLLLTTSTTASSGSSSSCIGSTEGNGDNKIKQKCEAFHKVESNGSAADSSSNAALYEESHPSFQPTINNLDNSKSKCDYSELVAIDLIKINDILYNQKEHVNNNRDKENIAIKESNSNINSTNTLKEFILAVVLKLTMPPTASNQSASGDCFIDRFSYPVDESITFITDNEVSHIYILFASCAL